MKKAIVALLVVLSTFLWYLYGQDLIQKTYLPGYKEAQRLYDLDEPSIETDSIALVLFKKAAAASIAQSDFKTAADCFIKAGNIHQTYQRFSLSNECYHRSLQINKSHLNDERLRYEALLYIGSSFYFSNVIDSAQYYFEEASSIAYKNTSGVLPEQERLYNSLGAIYFESANYLQAKNYFEKALTVTSASSKEYEVAFVGIKSNIANCLLRMNAFEEALVIYKSLLTYDTQAEVLQIIQQNTAHTYFELGYYDSALALYNKLPSNNALNQIKALNDIGRIYMNREQWQQSEAVFDSAIVVNKRISSTIKNKEEALAYLYRGQLAARQGLTDEAITWCNEALQEVHLHFTWKDMEDLPEDVSKTVSPITLFEILRTKASLLYVKYKATQQPASLIAALKTYRKAISLANFIKLNFDNDEAKLFFNKNYQPIYNEAIEIAYACTQIHNKYQNDYLFVLENYKGNVLYRNLQNIQLKSSAQVPDSIRKREKDIKQLLAFYTSRINYNATEKESDDLQKRLLELQVELSRLQKQYEKDASYNLYKYQSSQNELSIASVQLATDEETVLLNYYITPQAIYLLAISKEQSVVKKIAIDSSFYTQANYFIDEVYRHSEGNRYDGNTAAAYLYQTFLAPVEDLVDAHNRWVIIPNGILYYLPVEGFKKSVSSKQYLVQSKVISYHYSFALLFQTNTHHTDVGANQQPLAMAPFAKMDDNILRSQFPALPYSGEEIASWKQNIFLSADATKSTFLQNAGQHSRIHLATHASIGADSATNWIQFYPRDTQAISHKLFVPEIYNLDLHQLELIILSACETAGGTATAGEGLLSLSRAFLYAGSDGIISTLWKTEDKVTSYLMQQLHFYLNKNMAPEKALQSAKIDLLENKDFGAQYKTPNYWSNFIYVGKIDPVKNAGVKFGWWIAIFLLSIFAMLWWRKKKAPVKIPEPN